MPFSPSPLLLLPDQFSRRVAQLLDHAIGDVILGVGVQHVAVLGLVENDHVLALTGEVLQHLKELLLDGLDQLLTLLEELAFHAEFGLLHVGGLGALASNLVLALAANLRGQQDAFGPVGRLQLVGGVVLLLDLIEPAGGEAVQLLLGICVFREVLQDVLRVDVGVLLGTRSQGAQQQKDGKEEEWGAHGVMVSENRVHRGLNVQLHGFRTCAYKSPMFMPREKWNWPRAMVGAQDVVETPSVIQSNNPNMGRDPHAAPPARRRRIEPLARFPRVARLEERHRVNRGTRVGAQRVAQLRPVLGDGPGARVLVRGGQGQVVIPPQGNDLPPVEYKSAQEDTAQIEPLEGRQADLAVVLSDDAASEVGAQHQDLGFSPTVVNGVY